MQAYVPRIQWYICILAYSYISQYDDFYSMCDFTAHV